MSVEVKVGILFLLIALLAVVAGLFLTQAGGRLNTYEIVVHFKDTKGLAPGANVLLSGVNIGKVVKVELAPDPKFPEHPVAITLAIKRSAALFETDQLVIDQGSLLGDKFVTVKRLTQKELQDQRIARGKPLPPDAEVLGGPVQGFSNMAEQMTALIDQAKAAISAVTQTYATPEIRQGISALLKNANQASGQMQVIANNTVQLIGTLNHIVAANQASITHTMKNVEASTEEIQTAIHTVNEAISGIATGPLPAQILITVGNMRKISDEIRASVEAIRGLVCDTKSQEQVKCAMADLCQTAADVKAAAAAVKGIATDPRLATDLKTTLDNIKVTTDNLREISEASKQIMTSKENLEAINTTIKNMQALSGQGVAVAQKASGALDRVDHTMDQLSHVAGTFTPAQTSGVLRLESVRHAPLRTDMNIDLGWKSKDPHEFWRIGVRNLGASETLNLQRSLALGPDVYIRTGIFGSKPGIGLNYQFAPSGMIELEDWYPGENQLDLRAYLGLPWGISLTVGEASFLEDNYLSFGIQKSFNVGSRPAHPRP